MVGSKGPRGDERSAARRLVTVFLTLRGRLILLVCFTTIPAILFIFFAATREREAALERMETEARHLGSLASREHAHQLNGGRALLRRLAGAVTCGQEPEVPICPPYLPALLVGLPQFANIGVATPNGEIACSAAPVSDVADLEDNAAFEQALASRDVETGTYANGFVGRPVLHMAYAIRGAAPKPCAVAFVAVELDWLDDLTHEAQLPADYAMLITDRMGRVLARSGSPPPGAREREQATPALARALERPRGAVLELGSPGLARYFVATPMEGIPGIYVVAGLPYERVRSTANAAFYRTLIGLVLVTTFAIAAAILATELSVLRVLRALTRTVRRFGAGDLSARAPLPGSHGELRELAVSFSAMADALAARQREARDAQERLRALSHRLQTARDQEAGRIARELHDELGQILTGLKLELAGVRRLLSDQGRSPAGELALVQMGEQIDVAIDSVRRLSSELRPPVLDRLGLSAALEWLVQETEKKTGLSIVLDVREIPEALDALVSTTVFRIVQEALTNVVRHAEAKSVVIELEGRPTTIVLRVRDDGRGIADAAVEGPRSRGILGMRERVHLLGGSWSIGGRPGEGTSIEVEVPRTPPNVADAVASPEHES